MTNIRVTSGALFTNIVDSLNFDWEHEITHLFPSLGMDKLFYPTLHWASDYLFMQGLKLIHVS